MGSSLTYTGLMYAITAFVGPDDEVIVFEPFFDGYGKHFPPSSLGTDAHRYGLQSNLAGGQIVRVGMSMPVSGGATSNSTAGWTVDMEELERAVTPRTRMLVSGLRPMQRCGG